MQASTVWPGLLFFVSIGMTSDFHLVILHQGDIHSRYQVVDRMGITCRGEDFQRHDICHGGFARAVEYVKRVKKQPYTPNVLVVNTGDFFYGELMHVVFEWEISAAMAKHMPYDALALGDKEFHHGIDQLLLFMRELPPNVFVCTNMDFSNLNATLRDELQQLCPRHRVITLSGKKIGIVSYLTPTAMETMKVSELRVEDEIAALTREIAVLRRKGVKLFVALGHAGYEWDLEVARSVPSLDVVVGGHSHTLLWPDPISHQEAGVPPDPLDAGWVRGPYPTVVVQPSGRRVLLLHAFFAGKYVGNINVTFNADDEVKDWWLQPKLLEENMPEDPAAKATVDEFERRLQNASTQVVGSSLVQLVGLSQMCHQEECNLGNMLGDALLWSLRSFAPDTPLRVPNIALVNGGLMRHSIQLGNVTLRHLTDVLSWRNMIDVIVINGSTLLAALEHGVSAVEQLHGRFLQVSGAHYAVDVHRPPGQRVSDVKLLCDECAILKFYPLNLSMHYRVALSSYIADGGDGFDMLTWWLERQYFGLLDINLLANFIAQTSPVYSIVEGRIDLLEEEGEEEEAHHHTTGGQQCQPAGPRTLLAASLLISIAVVLSDAP